MLQHVYRHFGVFAPTELDLLGRVYTATLLAGASDDDCEDHAANLLRLYTNSGIGTEQDLIAAMRHSMRR